MRKHGSWLFGFGYIGIVSYEKIDKNERMDYFDWEYLSEQVYAEVYYYE